MRGNPKPETRNPKEGRIPKSEHGSELRAVSGRPFGFRNSAFGFPSEFGLRISVFPLPGRA